MSMSVKTGRRAVVTTVRITQESMSAAVDLDTHPTAAHVMVCVCSFMSSLFDPLLTKPFLNPFILENWNIFPSFFHKLAI